MILLLFIIILLYYLTYKEYVIESYLELLRVILDLANMELFDHTNQMILLTMMILSGAHYSLYR
jgi:hypothetical protein